MKLMNSKLHNASILTCFHVTGNADVLLLQFWLNIMPICSFVYKSGNRTHDYIRVPGISKGSIITSLPCSCSHDSSKTLEKLSRHSKYVSSIVIANKILETIGILIGRILAEYI